MPRPVAVIDIGSNSIKLLVATRADDGSITTLLARAIDARIGTGLGHAHPHLGEEPMGCAIVAVQSLLADAAAHAVDKIILVATSAVRDARNAAEFRDRVKRETGHEVRVLDGAEEARLIGRGLTCDPALRDLRDFYVFDLGGGSLECLAFRDRQLEQSASLRLGCIRLMERYVPDVTRTLGRTPRYRIMQHVHDELVRGAFKFSLPHAAVAVGTGGTINTVRAILAAREGRSFEETDSFVALTQLRLLLTRMSRMTLAERQQVPGLPVARADVFPTALATLIVLADVAAVPGFRHSLYNLRYGMADETLGATP